MMQDRELGRSIVARDRSIRDAPPNAFCLAEARLRDLRRGAWPEAGDGGPSRGATGPSRHACKVRPRCITGGLRCEGYGRAQAGSGSGLREWVMPEWVRPEWVRPEWVGPEWVGPEWVRPEWVRPVRRDLANREPP